MKKILFTAIILSLIGLLSANSVAYLSSAKGKVNLSRNSKEIKFQPGDMLENKDVLMTGAESFAAYKFIDGTTNIKVFSNSEVVINSKKVGNSLNKNVKITKGSILSNVKSGGGAFQVETPTTVASVRGTGFLTKVSEEGITQITVTDGEVLIEIKESGESEAVQAGKTAVIDEFGTVSIEQTTEEQIDEIEKAEIEATRTEDKKQMRIQVTDDQGNIRYINISY